MDYPKEELERLSEKKNPPLKIRIQEPSREDENAIYLDLFGIFSKTFDPKHNFPNANDALKEATAAFTQEIRTLPYAATANVERYVDAMLSSPQVLKSLDLTRNAYAYAQNKLNYVAVKALERREVQQEVSPLLHLVLSCTSDYTAVDEVIAVTRLFQMRKISTDYHFNFKMYAACMCGDVLQFLLEEVFHTLVARLPEEDLKKSYLFLSPQLFVWTIRTGDFTIVFEMKPDYEATFRLDKKPLVPEAVFLGGFKSGPL